MIELKFEQRPMPWSRPARGKNGKAYTLSKQRKYIEDLALMLKQAALGEQYGGAVHASLLFDYRKDKPCTIIRLEDYSFRPDLKTTRGDIDNLAKMVLEAIELSGIVKDDAQIAMLKAEKIK